MLFDIQELFSELANHELAEKRNVAAEYSKNFPNDLKKNLVEQVWYKEYVSRFKPFEYAVPHAMEEDFDWSILMQLAAASFSAQTKIIVGGGGRSPEFQISVENSGGVRAKMVSELFGYQIYRLFKIYVEENMNLQNHIISNEQEKREIQDQREFKVAQWKYRSKIVFESEKELEVLLQG